MDLWGKPEDEFLDLNEAEEILRQLRKEDPAEFERIATLRDGIRTARPSLQKGLFVFCQAGRFQQLFLLDDKGAVVSRDVPRVVGTVKCAPDAKAADLPDGYNKAVMAVQRTFAEEVKHREAERKHSFNLTHGQLYALRELRILFEATTEEEIKGNVNILEKAFRGALTGAVKRELNQLRRNAVTGEAALQESDPNLRPAQPERRNGPARSGIRGQVDSPYRLQRSIGMTTDAIAIAPMGVSVPGHNPRASTGSRSLFLFNFNL